MFEMRFSGEDLLDKVEGTSSTGRVGNSILSLGNVSIIGWLIGPNIKVRYAFHLLIHASFLVALIALPMTNSTK